MDDSRKTKQQLIAELQALRQQTAKSNAADARASVAALANRFKAAEEELERLRTEYDKFFDCTLDLLCIADTDGYFRRLNPPWEKVLGYGIHELEGKRFLDFVHPDDVAATLEVMKDLTSQKEVLDFVNRYRCKDGSYRFIEWRSMPVGSAIYAAARDITQGRKAEQELIESEARYRSIVENITDGFIIHDFDGNIVDVNDNACRMFGYSRQELVGASLAKVEWVGMAQHRPNRSARLVAEGGLTFDSEATRKDGTRFPVTISSKAVTREGGGIAHSFIRDISERRRAEDRLRDSEEKYRVTFENTGSGTVLIEEDTTISLASVEFERLTGYSKEEVEGKKSWTELVVKEDLDRMLAQHRLRRENRDAALKHYEFRLLTKQGRARDIYLTIELIPGTRRSVASLVDITERKLAEEALRESEARLSMALDVGNAGIWEWNLLSDEIRFDAQFHAMLGYTDGELPNRAEEWKVYHHPDDLQMMLSNAEAYLRGESPVYENEHRIRTKAGTWTWVFTRGKVVKRADSGSPEVFVGIAMDITERKRAEEALRKSEERFEQVAQQSREIVWEVDADGLYTYVSQACEVILGYRPDEMIGRMRFYDIHPEQGREQFRQAIFALFAAKESIRNLPNKALTKDGHIVWFSTNGVPVLDKDGTLNGYIGSDLDITETRRVAEALQQSESNLATFFDTIDEFLIVTDLQGTILKANQTALRRLRYSESDLTGQSMLMMYSQNQRVEAHRVIRDAVTHGGSHCTIPTLTKNGTHLWVETHLRRGVWDGSDALFAVSKDVSDLRLSEERFSKSFHTNAALMALSTVEDGRFIDVNESFLNTLGFERAEVIGKTSSELAIWTDHSQRKTIVQDLARNGRVRDVEIDMKDSHGNIVHGLFFADLVDLQGVPHLLTVMLNITDRKRVEEALRWRTAFFEAQVNSSLDGILVVDNQQKRLLTNHRIASLWNVPRHIIDDPDDTALLTYVTGLVKDPEKFYQKIRHLYDHPDETSQDEVEFVNGMVLDRYSSPVLDKEGRYYGRIWTFRDITERKRAEAQLKALSSRNEALLASVPDIIMEVDNNKVYTWANAAGYEFFGDDVCGKEAADYFIGEQQTYSRVKPLFGGREDVVYLESWQRRRDGQPRLLGWWCRVLKDAQGNVTGALSTARDVTDQKLADDRLRESEERYRGIFHTTLEGIFQTTPGGQYRDANPAFARMLGYDSPQDLMESVTDIGNQIYAVPADREEIKRRLATDGVVMGFETQLRRKDSSIICVLINAAVQMDGQGRIEYYHGGMIDITERKTAEKALRDSEEKFRRIAERAFDVILTTRLDGVITYVSPSVRRVFGYAPDEMTGKTIMAFAQEPDAGELIRASVEIAEGKHIESRRYHLRKKDGSTALVEMNALPVYKESTVVGGQAILRDITETKRLQEQESRAQRLETAGQIAGQVAHDFNNLLAPLVAYPEFIRDGIPSDHPGLGYLDAIESAANKIAEINQQLLTLGRRGHYTQDILNLNTVIPECLRDIGFLPDTLSIKLDLGADIMCIAGGSAQIHRVITNLLSNARDAMKDSGVITIRTENCYIDDAMIAFSRIPIGEYVRVTVCDTGCGIPDHLLPNIFDPFFTTKTTDKERGSGLGLSVVDAVVRDHGGYVDLSTQVGAGTSFFLYFPITRESVDESCVEQASGGTETVLVVDDDEIQRDVSARILGKLGYQVTVIAGGEEAVKFLKKHPQDLLVLDMVMPSGIDGAETYRLALDVNPSQKAIIVSGFSETDRVLQAQALGAGAFVRKPVTVKSIAAAVRNELDAKPRRILLQ